MTTYVPIASQTTSSTVSTVFFRNIPQNYTDLVVVLNCAGTIASNSLGIQFNLDTGNNYSVTDIRGNGSTTGSSKYLNQNMAYLASSIPVTTTLGTAIYIGNIMNYSNTNTFKNMLARNSISASGAEATVNTWRNIDAINSLTFSYTGGNFISGSTFNIYGITGEDVTAKAIGGDVTTDGTYYYHTFKNSSIFTPLQSLNVDYLVIAGGGAGSAGQTNNSIGAGGGAGGLRSTVTATGGGGSLESQLSLVANTNYTVEIGAGGSATTSVPNQGGTNGNNSIFSTITSIGGGAGGGYYQSNVVNNNGNGQSGGSGGGGRMGSTSGGSGTANQGYAGGNGSSVSGGAGGGAGGSGGNGSGSTGGNGGSGISLSTWASATATGVSNFYAGGGAGASDTSSRPSGGAGGGGIGSAKNNGNAGPGTGNTGSGGGGGTAGDGSNQWGGNGGSGIVIVRYLI